MQQLKRIIFFSLLLLSIQSFAQNGYTYEAVDNKTYALYQKSAWAELISYGNTAIENGQDFTLLRLRIAYAEYMLQNYSAAIISYEKVLKNDSYNATAHYYIWLCRKYLNQTELAGRQIKYLSAETIEKENLKNIAFTGAGLETSFKSSDNALRGNTFYQNFHAQNRFGYNILMDQMVSFYNQTMYTVNPSIQPGFPPPPPQPQLRGTSINQKEYYNKLTVNLTNQWQVKAAYHYTYNSIGTSIYNNQTGFVGLKYTGNYFDLQADALFSNITDTSVQQFDAQLGLNPLGNMNLYSISTAIIRKRPNGSAFNFRQILGCKIQNSIWLEGNITLGNFNDLLENDGLYIYNAIDRNLFKGGLSTYITITPKCTLSLGYTMEQRELKSTTTNFIQHSITGGLSWKF